jgi:hypothetical protein
VPRGNIGTLENIRDAIEAAGVEFIPASGRRNGGGPRESGGGRRPVN